MSDLATWWTSISKTFAGSFIAERATGYWKRFAASVTASAHKYRYDPFFRSEVTIFVLQGAFAVFILLLVGIIATQLYHDASVAVMQGIHATLAPDSTPSSIGASVSRDLGIAVTVVFTYIIARIALSPTRNALESQKRFIGNVAHELRTPLAVSKTNLEVALMAPVIEPSLKRALTSTVEELDRISEILNNLLSLSASIRPERIEFTNVDLGTVVQNIVRKLRPLTESKRLELEVRMSERRVVWGNVTALEQIVMNVTKNAVSYTTGSGRVLITVEPVHPDLIELTVRDSGRGIARTDLFHIFEPYYRGDPSRKRGEGRAGLGLTIVSEHVKLHGGRIAVRSAEGRGTTVTVLLPAGRAGVGTIRAQAKEEDTASEIAVDFSHGKRGS
jgi:signal transduction histidine kinase